MKPTHTPGPWAVNPSNAQVDAFDNGEPLPVCQMLWPTDKRSEDETMANAQLIAKAPEMCQALAEIAFLADTYANDADDIIQTLSRITLMAREFVEEPAK